MMQVSIQREDFDVATLQDELLGSQANAGALVSFVGLVRNSNEGRDVHSMELEHYPGMTERSIAKILEQARQRWDLIRGCVIHRVGRLRTGERIVYVGVTSPHRGDAFAACEFVMDYLKTQAPFWKKEHSTAGQHWVDARQTDTAAAQRWRESSE